MNGGGTRNTLLALIRRGEPMTRGQKLRLTWVLSIPAIMAQLSTIIMQYIDAAMVGSLGAEASASIGLMSTSTWLFWGLCSGVASGFSVQVAHRIGANDHAGAQQVLRQAIIPTLAFSGLLALTGVIISSRLPLWLGASQEIAPGASLYFMIFTMAMPVFQLSYVAGGVLRCSGNTFFPGMVNIGMCVLDVMLNAFLIFPSGTLWGLPGAGLGVAGAALGTAGAETVGAAVLLWYLWRRNATLNMRGSSGRWMPTRRIMGRATRIGAPLAGEHLLMCGAQIFITAIVAPLGTVAIAANAFAVTAESLCYMPGYGISEASTALVGQSLGASRKPLARSFANITVWSGILVMTLMGVLMYIFAPLMMGIITPVEEICRLGTEVLRIEAWAEPMFAASIVAYGVMIGAGDTLIPSLMNLGSIWGVRVTAAALLAPTMGLRGVWIAMAIELTFRGLIFLWRLYSNAWTKAKA